MEGGLFLDTAHLIWEDVMVCLYIQELILFSVHTIYSNQIHIFYFPQSQLNCARADGILFCTKLGKGCCCYCSYRVKLKSTPSVLALGFKNLHMTSYTWTEKYLLMVIWVRATLPGMRRWGAKTHIGVSGNCCLYFNFECFYQSCFEVWGLLI